MNKISKREQFLLFMLAMVLVSVLFYVFVWTPAQFQKSEALNRKSQLETEKATMDATLPLYDSLSNQLSDGVESINLELDSIEHNLSEAQFERWLFPLFDQLGVVVVSSDFTSPTVASPDSMIYVKNDPMYSIKEMINNINDISSTQKTKPMSESVLLKSSFSYELILGYQQYATLLDSIADWKTTFFVNSSSYNFVEETATITIDAYTIDKFEPADESRYEGDYPTDNLKSPNLIPETEVEGGSTTTLIPNQNNSGNQSNTGNQNNTGNPNTDDNGNGNNNDNENPFVPLPDIEGNK